MKKSNVLIELLKLLAAIVIGWVLWIVIFTFTITPDNAEMTVEPFNGAAFLFGAITGLLIELGLKYNAVRKAYQQIKSSFSNIEILEEHSKKLLDKANRVVDKYLNYEGSVQLGISHDRAAKANGKNIIHNAQQFGAAIENYPNLKANESIMELLHKIQESENRISSQKSSYNAMVENYNTIIHSFPTVILCIIFRFKDAEFYSSDLAADEIISDENLGI